MILLHTKYCLRKNIYFTAEDASNATVNYVYADTGELLQISGADTYTQSFTYNAFGNMASLTTCKGIGLAIVATL